MYPVVGEGTAGWDGEVDPLYTGRDYHVAAIICENLAANQHEPVTKVRQSRGRVGERANVVRRPVTAAADLLMAALAPTGSDPRPSQPHISLWISPIRR